MNIAVHGKEIFCINKWKMEVHFKNKYRLYFAFMYFLDFSFLKFIF